MDIATKLTIVYVLLKLCSSFNTTSRVVLNNDESTELLPYANLSFLSIEMKCNVSKFNYEFYDVHNEDKITGLLQINENTFDRVQCGKWKIVKVKVTCDANGIAVISVHESQTELQVLQFGNVLKSWKWSEMNTDECERHKPTYFRIKNFEDTLIVNMITGSDHSVGE